MIVMSYWIDIDKTEMIRMKNAFKKKGFEVQYKRGKTANYGSKENPRYSRFFYLFLKRENNVQSFPCFWDTTLNKMVVYYAINDQ